MSDIGLILLAAGGASRMGTPKQLMDFRGQPLVRHAARIALSSGCRPVVVVIGAAAAPIREALTGLEIVLAENPRWEDGVGTSIQTGVAAAAAHGVEAVILALADQPMLTAAIYDRLVAEHRRSGLPIVASEYSGTVGVPVLFGREFFASLQALEPGQGCKGVILRHSARALRVPCLEAEVDLDTPADYERLTHDPERPR